MERNGFGKGRTAYFIASLLLKIVSKCVSGAIARVQSVFCLGLRGVELKDTLFRCRSSFLSSSAKRR